MFYITTLKASIETGLFKFSIWYAHFMNCQAVAIGITSNIFYRKITHQFYVFLDVFTYPYQISKHRAWKTFFLLISNESVLYMSFPDGILKVRAHILIRVSPENHGVALQTAKFRLNTFADDRRNYLGNKVQFWPFCI